MQPDNVFPASSFLFCNPHLLLSLFGLFPTCCMVFKRGKMTRVDACGNVGNVLSKQVKHLQLSTSKTLPLAHLCLWFAQVKMLQQLLVFVSFLHSNLRHLFPCGSRKQGTMNKRSIIALLEKKTRNYFITLTL